MQLYHYIKCERYKYTNEKTETVRVDWKNKTQPHVYEKPTLNMNEWEL